MLLESSDGFHTKADEIIKISIWKPLDIQIDWRALNLQLWVADHVDLAIADCESFEGVVILLAASGEPLEFSTGSEHVGELGYGKNAFRVKALPLLFRHPGQKAEVVFLHRLLPTPAPKLAFDTMPI